MQMNSVHMVHTTLNFYSYFDLNNITVGVRNSRKGLKQKTCIKKYFTHADVYKKQDFIK
jgi:hypothetical protein